MHSSSVRNVSSDLFHQDSISRLLVSMGVHGLWDLVAPAGRQVPIEHLANKVVAVDVSIWLTQFIKAMRDANGMMFRNAHLLGFLRRCLRLLYHNIKPVFVFDGATLHLKRRILQVRFANREKNALKLRKVAEKLLVNRIKAAALDQVEAGTNHSQNVLQSLLQEEKPKFTAPEHGTEVRSQLQPKEGGTPNLADAASSSLVLQHSRSAQASFEIANQGVTGDSEIVNDESVEKLSANEYRASSSKEPVVPLFKQNPGTSRPVFSDFDPRAKALSELRTPSGVAVSQFLRRRPRQTQKADRLSDEHYVLEEAGPTERSEGSNEGNEELNLPEDEEEIDFVAVSQLPVHVQTEIFETLRLRRRIKNRAQSAKHVIDPAAFSSAQVDGFLKSIRLNTRIKTARGMVENAHGSRKRIASDHRREYTFSKKSDGDAEGRKELDGSRTQEHAHRLESREFPKHRKPTHANELLTSGGSTDPPKASGSLGVLWASTALGKVRRDHELLPVERAVQARMYSSGYSLAVHDDELEDENMIWEDASGSANASMKNAGSRSTQGHALGAGCKSVVNSLLEIPEAPRKKRRLISLDRDEAEACIDKSDRDIADDMIICRGSANLARKTGQNIHTRNNLVTAWKPGDFRDGSLSTDEKDVVENPSNHEATPRVQGQEQGAVGDLDMKAVLPEAVLENENDPLLEEDPLQQERKGHIATISVSWESQNDADGHIEDDTQLARAIQLSLAEFNTTEFGIGGVANTEEMRIVVDSTYRKDENVRLAKYAGLPSERTHGFLQGGLSVDDGFADHAREDMHIHPVRSKLEPKEPDSSDDKHDMSVSGILPPAEALSQSLNEEKSRSPLESPLPLPGSFESQSKEPEQQRDSFYRRILDEEMDETKLQALRDEIDASNELLTAEARNARIASEHIADEMYAEIVDLLKLFGLPYLEAPFEAEAQCAWLNEQKLVDAVITEDSDAFLFGAQVVYRNVFERNKHVETYDIRDIERELGVNRHAMIRMALLLGSDYTDGVRGIGIVNAMEVIQAFPEVENETGLKEFAKWVREVHIDNFPGVHCTKFEPGSAKDRFAQKHKNLKRNWIMRDDFPNSHVLDAYENPSVDRNKASFRWRAVNKDGLVQFCWDKFGWSAHRASETLLPVLNRYDPTRAKVIQTRMEDFFRPQRFAKIRSQRLHDAVTGLAGADVASNISLPTVNRSPTKPSKAPKIVGAKPSKVGKDANSS